MCPGAPVVRSVPGASPSPGKKAEPPRNSPPVLSSWKTTFIDELSWSSWLILQANKLQGYKAVSSAEKQSKGSGQWFSVWLLEPAYQIWSPGVAPSVKLQNLSVPRFLRL